ncbi:MAG: hypothetical protein ACLU3I_08735 [Acutalibacteraceae bacterium]
MRRRRNVHARADRADHGLLRFGPEYFIPTQVGLPEQRDSTGSDPEEDHCWFELSEDGFEETARRRRSGSAHGSLAENFAAAKEHWNDTAFQTQMNEMTLRKKFLRAAAHDELDDYIDELNPYGYQPFTMEELLDELMRSSYLFDSVPYFFAWASKVLAAKVHFKKEHRESRIC